MITLRIQAFDLPLKHVFTIARGSVSVQRTMIVEASSSELHGYGEATENTFYGASVEQMAALLDKVRPILEAAEPGDLESILAKVSPLLLADVSSEPGEGSEAGAFALCALDCALHDLWGKTQGEPCGKLWGLDPAQGPQSSFTIGIDAIPKMVAKLEEEPDWPIYKIKLGTPADIAIVEELRKHTAAPFRVDANCGWTVTQAVELSRALADLNVEFIEQPLSAQDREGMRELRDQSALPLIADESCVSLADVDRCDGLFHGINIKLVKCGGLAPARRMIERARELGLKLMMGCMTESTVGISAIAQLLPLLDYVDMDGAALLASDIATGAKVINGKCQLPELAGLGITMNDGPFEAA